MEKIFLKRYIVDNEKLISEWDWEKNSSLGLHPSSTSDGSHKKAWWICKKGHSYDAKIVNRNHGTDCPYCKGKKVLKGFNDLETWCKNNNRLDLIKEFDGSKNNFTMQELTKGSGKEIWWICPHGHSYSATLHHRINMNTGCGICSHKVFSEGNNDLQTTHPKIALEFDVVKNKITPNKVMAGSNNKKYWFICPKGHSYKSTLLNRKKGRNCPQCMKEMHVSFPEKCIAFYLKKCGIEIIEGFHASFLNKMELDIFLTKYQIAIEYDGRAWHKNIQRDLIKDELCYNNNIKLIRIREEGCPNYESTSINYTIDFKRNDSLEQAIKFIIKIIDPLFLDGLEINIEKDRNDIYELLELNEKSNSLQDRFPQIVNFWDAQKNGKLTPKQISFSSEKPIYLKCPNNHEWLSTAHKFINSPCCPICSGERILPGFNDLGTTHPHLKKIWSKNNIKSIADYSFGSNALVKWICEKCNGEYEMKIIEKSSKNFGCPYCNNRKLLVGYNDLKTRYPKIADEWSSSNSKNPNEVLPCSKEIVLWECKNKHIYKAKILSRVSKNKGCPYCNNIEVLPGFNDLETCNYELSKEFDVERNNLLPSKVVYGGKKVYWWKCRNGHSYDSQMCEKIKGNGCPICSNHRLLVGYNDLQTLNPKLASEFDNIKNVGKTPQDFFLKSGKKVWWKCSKCGHQWMAQIIKRSNGQGCPECFKNRHTKSQ